MSRTARPSDAFARVAAAGVVPAVAVAAHGAASGAMPSSSGVLLSAAIGVVALSLGSYAVPIWLLVIWPASFAASRAGGCRWAYWRT